MKTVAIFPLLFLCLAAAPNTQPLPARLGGNIDFTKPQPGEIKMMADAGVNTIRMDFAWGGTEHEKGKYDFSAYDGLMAALDEYKIGAVFILDYSNRLYDDGLSPHTDAGREAFAKWAAAAVTHFKSRNIIWEIYNEPNIGFWKPKPDVDAYAKLAIATGKAIRAAVPDAHYVGPASSTIDLPFLETCFKAGCLEYWDAVSVHPYRQSEPETAAKEYRELRHLIAKYAPVGKQIPIYSGEWGYSAAWNKYDEEKQAMYLPRQWLTNIMNDVPLSIWYDWHDDGRDPNEPEHHFGTVQNEKNKEGPEPWKPKAAYLATKTFGEQLRGFEFNKRLAVGDRDKDFVLFFAKFDSHHDLVDVRLAVWTTGMPHDLVISSMSSEFRSVDHLGKEIGDLRTRKSKRGEELVVVATRSTTYLIPKTVSEALKVVAACERIPLEIVAPYKDGHVNVPLVFNNPFDRKLSIGSDTPESIPIPTRVQPNKSIDLSSWYTGEPDEDRIFGVAGLIFPDFGTVYQWVDVSPTNAVKLEFLGTVKGQLLLRLRDLGDSDAEVNLFVHVKDPDVFEQKVQLTKDQRVVVIPTTVRVPPRMPTIVRYAVTHTQQTNRIPIRNEPKFTFLDDFAEPKPAFRVVADGDKQLKSEQSIARAQPSEGPLAAGIGSLELAYHFTPGHKFIQIMPTKEELRPLPGKPRELRLWVFGDASGHLARCRVTDSTGQTFQPNGTKITWQGWKLVTFPLGGSDNGHWGGNNDGEMHYPLKLDTLFLLDNVSKQASEGKIYIASPMTVE